MGREHVNHSHIVKFAQEKVNLPKDAADKYRAQVRRLRDQLAIYLQDHPDFSLRKMQLSGSLAKGTALRSINDIDVACYISGIDESTNVPDLLDYLTEKLRKAFPNFGPDQVTQQTYSITVSFRGTGLDVDVVPILYDGNPQWYGNLVSQEDGSLLATSIPLHLEFTRKRKQKHEKDFSQVVRLVKFWARQRKKENRDFRFKSFKIEMILSHLSDSGVDFSDYPEALQAFFTYVITSRLSEKIIFSDYYGPSKVGDFDDPIQIIDPVNPENNVGRLYDYSNVESIVEAAMDAGDAIDAAAAAITKERTLHYWRKVFGPSFAV